MKKIEAAQTEVPALQGVGTIYNDNSGINFSFSKSIADTVW